MRLACLALFLIACGGDDSAPATDAGADAALASDGGADAGNVQPPSFIQISGTGSVSLPTSDAYRVVRISNFVVFKASTSPTYDCAQMADCWILDLTLPDMPAGTYDCSTVGLGIHVATGTFDEYQVYGGNGGSCTVTIDTWPEPGSEAKISGIEAVLDNVNDPSVQLIITGGTIVATRAPDQS